MSKNLAIIPVRTGSKRLTKKNIREFHGRPLFTYSVNCAINSGLFDEIHISTESEEVEKMCIELDVPPPFMRPEHLATDESTLQQVCEFVINEYSQRGSEFDSFCILWATSPMRLPEDITNAFMLLDDTEAVVSTCEYDMPYFSGHELMEHNNLRPLFPKMLHGKQKRPTIVSVNSSLCWVKTKDFLEQKTWLPKKLKSYKMPRYRSTDIDTSDDWDLAEFLYSKYAVLDNE
jgi:CMP-N-acetylneuraminic acid synthetase